MAMKNRTNLKEYDGSLARMPNVAADITTTDTWIYQLVFTNTTGGALTVTLKDRQGVARYLQKTRSIAANTTLEIAYPEGVKMKSGVNWVASADGIDCAITAFYLP